MDSDGSRAVLLFGFVLALALCAAAGLAAVSALGLFQQRAAPTEPMPIATTPRATIPAPTTIAAPPQATEPPAPPTPERPATPTPVVVVVQPTTQPASPTTEPTPTPTRTPTPTPTPTRTPTPTVTLTPTSTATPTPSPYAGPYREGNGVDLHARPAPFPPYLDGTLNEWNAVQGQDLSYIIGGAQAYEGIDDIAGTVYAQWDSDHLYLAARVTDDVHVQTQRGERINLGDALIIWIDADLAGDFDTAVANDDDYQIGLSPGDFATIPPEGVIWRPQQRPEWNQAITVGAQRDGNGYTLEASIPWSVFGRKPSPGQAFGFSAQLLDNDTPGFEGVETVLSGAPKLRPGAPTTFGNLILDGH